MMVVAILVGLAAAQVQAVPSRYEVALQCLVAVNEADAIERGQAGKETGNTATFAKLRDKYQTVIVWEGLSLGKTREQIASEYRSRQDVSVITQNKTSAEIRAAFTASFARASACNDKI